MERALIRHRAGAGGLAKETRGKTARDRLRRVDTLVALWDPGLLRRRDGDFADALVVDLGYGARPDTAVEMAARLRRIGPGLGVLGVERDRARVRAAEPAAGPGLAFREGGFDLPLRPAERVRMLRAFNVLRQYEEGAAREAQALMGAQLLGGGLLVEGTSTPRGRRFTAQLLRREEGPGAALRLEALVFGTNFRAGVAPELFPPILPKAWIHRMQPGEPVFAFFEAWEAAHREARAAAVWGPRYHWRETARRLRATGWPVDSRARLLDRGYLALRGGPEAAAKAGRDLDG